MAKALEHITDMIKVNNDEFEVDELSLDEDCATDYAEQEMTEEKQSEEKQLEQSVDNQADEMLEQSADNQIEEMLEEPVENQADEQIEKATEADVEATQDENAQTDEELKNWLFKESVRVESEKKELNELYLKFLEEKKQFQSEMKYLNKRVLEERKRLKEEELFFEKKMEILKGGFAQLEADRKAVEREKIQLQADRAAAMKTSMGYEQSVRLFFKGATNPLTLKKRYRDLIKIFHPDNLCGDTDLLQKINRVYEELQDEIGWQKKA